MDNIDEKLKNAHPIVHKTLLPQEQRVLYKTMIRWREEAVISYARAKAYSKNFTPIQKEVLLKILNACILENLLGDDEFLGVIQIITEDLI